MSKHRGWVVGIACAVLLVGGCGSDDGAERAQSSRTQEARETLSTRGIGDIELGQTLQEIQDDHASFPDVATTGAATVEFRDAAFGFVDGELDSIAPTAGGRTVDGLTRGSDVAEAFDLYGQPIAGPTEQDGLDWLVFDADADAGTAYRIGVDGLRDPEGDPSGEVSRVTLCRCDAAPAGDANGELTFGNVSVRVPDGWVERPPTGGTSDPALVELAPDRTSTTSIAVYAFDLTNNPDMSWAALEADGIGGPTTVGGRQAWTYGVTHTVSSRGPEKYLLRWYYLFDGSTRVDVSCDALDDDASQAEMAPVCEEFVASVVVLD